jgi:hypothetical protein
MAPAFLNIAAEQDRSKSASSSWSGVVPWHGGVSRCAGWGLGPAGRDAFGDAVRSAAALLVGGRAVVDARYRVRCSGAVRVRRGALRYTDEEYAVIRAAASAARMRPGAWAQQAAYRAALDRGQDRRCSCAGSGSLLEELRQQRRVLTNVGGNLNDLARVANSTGAVHELRAIAVVLRLVANVVRSCDDVIGRVRSELPR